MIAEFSVDRVECVVQSPLKKMAYYYYIYLCCIFSTPFNVTLFLYSAEH